MMSDHLIKKHCKYLNKRWLFNIKQNETNPTKYEIIRKVRLRSLIHHKIIFRKTVDIHWLLNSTLMCLK